MKHISWQYIHFSHVGYCGTMNHPTLNCHFVNGGVAAMPLISLLQIKLSGGFSSFKWSDVSLSVALRLAYLLLPQIFI